MPSFRDAFVSDPVVQDAVVWRLQAIADAARNHLSDVLKARHPEVNWRGVYAFRTVAAHQYADINLDVVWEIATEHLDDLRHAIERELSSA